MRVSDNGLLEICEHEGIVVAPYKDSVGVYTDGVGHTASAGGHDPAKMDKAMPTDIDGAVKKALKVFREDIAKYEARVNKAILVPLEQYEFDALVSFDFNTGGIHRAQLTSAINRGEPDAYNRFMGWLKPPEIRKRRTAEMNLFRTGNYDANGDQIPVYKTDGKGNLKGVVKVMSGEDILSIMKGPKAVFSPKPSVAPLVAFFAMLASIFKRKEQ